MGSPRYMSPEQLREEHVTNQSDIFSLGVVMYELLTGRQPFPADNFSRLVTTILNDDPPPMSDYRPELPESLNKIVVKALEKDVANRYQMGLDLAADLTKAFDTLEKPKEDISAEEKFNSVKNSNFLPVFPMQKSGKFYAPVHGKIMMLTKILLSKVIWMIVSISLSRAMSK